MTTTGKDLLISAKDRAGTEGALILEVGRPPVAWLRPVATRAELVNADDVRVLTEWRNRHVTAFLTEFDATPERTRGWLTEHVSADDGRILFMLDDPAGATPGYMGLAYIDWSRSYGEVDAVVRGLPAPRGLMRQALCTLIDWAGDCLGLATVGVRVRSDNPALRFYEKAGFVEDRRVALLRTAVGDEVHWVLDPDASPSGTSLVFMTFRSEKRA